MVLPVRLSDVNSTVDAVITGRTGKDTILLEKEMSRIVLGGGQLNAVHQGARMHVTCTVCVTVVDLVGLP